MKTIELIKVPFNRAILHRIPERERIFFVQASHLHNEFNVLQKILIYTASKSENEFMLKAAVTQQQIIARILVGKLFEGWILFQRDFFGQKLSMEYDSKLHEQGRDSLRRIKKYFSSTNIVATLRNSYSFHYDSKLINPTIDDLPDELSIEMILSSERGNSLYYFAEEIISRSMISEIHSIVGTEGFAESLSVLYNDTKSLAGDFMNVIGELLVAMTKNYLGNSFEEMGASRHQINIDVDIENFQLPFYAYKKNM